MEVRYYINEKDIKADFGVYVSASAGILDLPKIKEPTTQDWKEYHGTIVDLDAPKLSNREINLECWINANSQFDFINKLNSFYAEFLKAGFKRLRIEIDNGVDAVKPLIYDCYIQEGIKITKQWSEGTQQGKFTLKLIEPNPQKKVLKFTATAGATQCQLSISTDKAVIITWGDNERTEEIFTDDFDVFHNYAAAGTYYISISGCIGEIKNLTINESNTSVIWDIL